MPICERTHVTYTELSDIDISRVEISRQQTRSSSPTPTPSLSLSRSIVDSPLTVTANALNYSPKTHSSIERSTVKREKREWDRERGESRGGGREGVKDGEGGVSKKRTIKRKAACSLTIISFEQSSFLSLHPSPYPPSPRTLWPFASIGRKRTRERSTSDIIKEITRLDLSNSSPSWILSFFSEVDRESSTQIGASALRSRSFVKKG